MHYRRPSEEVIITEREIKRSRFITFITRVCDEESARDFIASVRAQYPDARHHCSAYIYFLEGANPVERSSDDGEPSGTAGMPMLDVLKGSGLLDICAVVVRYFGGIKLGTGGLVRAYSDAVQQGLEEVIVTTRAQKDLYTVELEHADAGRIEAELRARSWEIIDTQYGEKVTLILAIDHDDKESLFSTVQALTSGTIMPQENGQQWVDKYE